MGRTAFIVVIERENDACDVTDGRTRGLPNVPVQIEKEISVADAIERVSTEDATAMALRLARDEGLFAGTSTGANVIAALRVAEQLGPDATVVTIMCDTGMKYLKAFGPAIATH